MTAAAGTAEDKPVDLEAIQERLSKLDGELSSEREERAKLQGQITSLGQAPAEPAEPEAPAKKVYTAAELEQAVMDGHITQSQSVQIIREQDKDSIREEIRASEQRTRKEIIAETALNAKKQAYIDAYPDVLVDGTTDRNKLLSSYNELVADGSPDSASTEIAAMKLAFGPPPNSTPRDKTAESREVDASGGGGAPGPASDAGGDDPSAGVKKTERQREHYTKKVASGAYTWDQAKLEIVAYRPGDGRARMGKPRRATA